ncbi:MAG: hypothetical protein ACOCXA_04060 [Planctomycetota bacterium]
MPEVKRIGGMQVDQELLRHMQGSRLQIILKPLILLLLTATFGAGLYTMYVDRLPLVFFLGPFVSLLVLSTVAILHTRFFVRCPRCGKGPIAVYNRAVTADQADEIQDMADMPSPVRLARSGLAAKRRGWYVDGTGASTAASSASPDSTAG